MLEDADGRALLRERRRVTDETVAHCWELPPHTFGGAYAAFMGQRGFRADDRPPVRYVDDAQLAYVATRAREVRHVPTLRRVHGLPVTKSTVDSLPPPACDARQVHDFWHVLFGVNTSVLGEAALKVGIERAPSLRGTRRGWRASSSREGRVVVESRVSQAHAALSTAALRTRRLCESALRTRQLQHTPLVVRGQSKAASC